VARTEPAAAAFEICSKSFRLSFHVQRCARASRRQLLFKFAALPLSDHTSRLLLTFNSFLRRQL
jgi:hypothetical protein